MTNEIDLNSAAPVVVDETAKANERRAKLAAKIIELQSQRDEIDEAITNLKASLSEGINEGKTTSGDFWIEKYMNTRWDDATAKKNLSPEDYAKTLGEAKSTSAKAKANLSEEEFKKGQKSFDFIIKVGLRDD